MTEPDPREALRAAYEAWCANRTIDTYREWTQAAYRCGYDSSMGCWTERYLADHPGPSVPSSAPAAGEREGG